MLARFPSLGIFAAPPKAWDAVFPVEQGTPPKPFVIEGDYACVDICGPLVQHSKLWGWCDDYDAIRERVAKALASEAKKIKLCINSPGGDFSGCVELGRALKAMASAAGKPLVAFTDSQCLSAAYAIACAADEIIATESSTVGSIGIWTQLRSVAALNAQMGYAVEILASGKHKADRNPDAPITDSARESAAKQVDDMAALFFAWVKEARGLDAKPIEGEEIFGRRGLALGLSDRIVNDWSDYIKGASQSRGEGNMSKYDEAMGALRQAAEGDDEDAKKAKKALKALEGDEKEEKEEKEAKAASEEKEEPKKEEKEEKGAKASAAFDVEATLKALTARNENEDKEKLLASRPDLNDAQKKFLRGLTVEQVAKACTEFPKGEMPNAAAGANATSSTQGASQGAGNGGAEDYFVSKAMGGGPAPGFYMGCGDPDAARKFLESKKAAAGNVVK